MLNRSETVVPNRPEVSASDLIPVFFRFFLFPAHTLVFISPLTPASFSACPAFSGFTPVFVLHYTRIRSY